MGSFISVIVPTYNNALWLPRCLDSLLAQTYENLEIIVVDDGSLDDTPSIMRDYLARDSRVKAIRKNNGGVTSARMIGIAEAAGDWIGFVDGDDWVEPRMYARLLENALEYQADISHCGYQMEYPDGRTRFYHNSGVLRLQDRQTGLRDLLEETLVEPGLWNKLFKRDLFENLEGQMDLSIKNNEDLLMNFYLFSKADRAIFEDVCPYHYMIRTDSASQRPMDNHRIYDPIRVRQIILETCTPELRQDAQRAMAETCLFVYAQLSLETGREYSVHRKNVRRVIKAQAEHLRLLPLRNAVLVWMVSYIPWMFSFVYKVYVTFFKDR